jgi:hypothetical protein
MLPNGNVFTPVPISAPFLPPRDVPNASLLVDTEMGGIGLSDPSQGVNYQPWTCTVDSTAAGHVYLSAANTPPTLVLTVPGITQVSFTFDQNMHPFIAFTQNGNARFYWFDESIPGFTTTTLDAGALTPRASLDDKRAFAVNGGGTDILLFYVLNNNLLMRQQRDRYTIAYTMATNLNVQYLGNTVFQVGMNQKLRFQVQMHAAFYVN